MSVFLLFKIKKNILYTFFNKSIDNAENEAYNKKRIYYILF